jgi:hypothetical protein
VHEAVDQAATATGSPKISAHAKKVLLELTTSELHSWREDTSAKNSEAPRVKRDVADFLDHEQRHPDQPLRLGLEVPGSLGRTRFEQPLVGGSERGTLTDAEDATRAVLSGTVSGTPKARDAS